MRFMHRVGRFGAKTAEVETIAQTQNLRAGGNEEVARGGDVDAAPPTRLAQDVDEFFYRRDRFVTRWLASRIWQARQEQRIEPFAVSRSGNRRA